MSIVNNLPYVRSLALLPNGDLAAGGFFTAAGGVSASHIARWDGVNWSALDAGTSGVVTALALLSNGDLMAGGEFSNAGGVVTGGIAQLTTTCRASCGCNFSS